MKGKYIKITPTTCEGANTGSDSVKCVVSPKKYPTLKLSSLNIKLETWGDHKGRYKASVKYEGNKGDVKLHLSPDLSDDLMHFIGGSIKRFSDSAMLELERSIEASIAESDSKAVLG